VCSNVVRAGLEKETKFQKKEERSGKGGGKKSSLSAYRGRRFDIERRGECWSSEKKTLLPISGEEEENAEKGPQGGKSFQPPLN